MYTTTHMDDQIPQPNLMNPTKSTVAQAGAVGVSPSPTQSAATSQGSSDALARATAAIEAVIEQTPQNPAARMKAIIDIKATYIRDQFGVDVTQ